MKPLRKRRLLLILCLLLGVGIATGLILYALKKNINVFYTPTQIQAGQVPHAVHFRVGGLVRRHSVVHAKQSLDVNFVITDLKQNLRIRYTGIDRKSVV